MEKKEITIFICEDEELRQELCKRYGITYSNILPAKKRAEVVRAIEELED